jgi:hypothetical protein
MRGATLFVFCCVLHALIRRARQNPLDAGKDSQATTADPAGEKLRAETIENWGGKRESNPQPSEPQSGALPVELFPPPPSDYSNYRGSRGATEYSRWHWSMQVCDGVLRDLAAPDANVFESQRAQASGIEQILGIDNDRPLEQVLDAVEIQGAKFRPARAHHQGIGTFGCGVS